MIKQEIIDKIGMYFKLTNFEAEQIYDDVFEYIVQGVKEDNAADINNLGEFIVRYNSGANEFDRQKSIEFVPASSFEDDIRESSSRQEENIWQQPVNQTEENVNVEDELKRKREDIINKMASPPEEYRYNAPEEQKPSSLGAFITPGVISQIHEDIKETAEPEKITEPEITESAVENKNRELEDIPQKSFSDFFSEVKESEKVVHEGTENANITESVNKTEIPPVESVIPPAAVELHNEITGSPNQNLTYQNTLEPPVSPNGNGDTENKITDNSYYIWYKDSEPNVADTQTMSYEYELLYQATKEAEYKSKLRIYVTTFILFFSIVLLLLIFSPVIYKYFFTPKEVEQNSEQIQQEEQVNPETNDGSQPPVNSTEGNNTENVTPPPVTNTEQTTQQTEQQTQENTNTQQNNTQNIEGITKNAIGWADAKNKVVYVQFENGKFVIQESSWDSDAKANKRLSVIASIIPDLKGKVTVSDLGAKGKWYRAMVGEFATIQEAKAKAEELRSKEKK